MSIRVDDVITAAREEHPGLSEAVATRPPIVRMLDRYRRTLLSDLVARYPDPVLTCSKTIREFPATLEDFDEGTRFPDHLFARGDRARFGETDCPLFVVSFDQRRWPPRRPAVAFRGGRLFFAGAPADWTTATWARIDYVEAPKPLKDTTSTLDPLPDYAENALVAAVAAFAAKRAPDIDAQPFANDRDRERAEFLVTATSQRRVTVRELVTEH